MNTQDNNENKSELSQLMQQIEDEFASASSALNDFMEGAAQHKFMIARTENIGKLVSRMQLITDEKTVKDYLNNMPKSEHQP